MKGTTNEDRELLCAVFGALVRTRDLEDLLARWRAEDRRGRTTDDRPGAEGSRTP